MCIKIRQEGICCICGKVFSGMGNNAQPVESGRCCDECNKNVVIPARINQMTVTGTWKDKEESSNDKKSHITLEDINRIKTLQLELEKFKKNFGLIFRNKLSQLYGNSIPSTSFDTEVQFLDKSDDYLKIYILLTTNNEKIDWRDYYLTFQKKFTKNEFNSMSINEIVDKYFDEFIDSHKNYFKED